MSTNSTDLARVFRAESGRVLAALLVQCRDIDLAEDALQDACLQASEQWTDAYTPDNKGAWLLTVARRRLIDRLRKSSFRNKESTIAKIISHAPNLDEDEFLNSEQCQAIPDERLKLIFTCCHPALSDQARVALTLKTLCGLSVPEIARAYLVSEIAMNQRITRAKRKIRDAGIAYEVPGESTLPSRLPSVLSVIYLIYNESYTAYEGQSLSREELSNEAVRLVRILFKLLPRPDVAGLLSLILFHQARFRARSSTLESYIPLEKQNRNLWDKVKMKEASKILITAMAKGQADTYQLQAAISALHSEANSWPETDWIQIQLLYQILFKLSPTPVVALNQAIAVANSGDLNTALRTLKELENSLKGYQPYYAARADIEAKCGNNEYAKYYYNKAIGLTQNNSERDYLVKQRSELIKCDG